MAASMTMCLAVALLAAAAHAADAATAATETPLVLQAEHQDVNATLTAGGAKVEIYSHSVCQQSLATLLQLCRHHSSAGGSRNDR